MADNIISQYYTKNDGMQISNDYQFSILQGNEKIINKNSGEKFVKNPSYSNVFDKTNTFTDYLNDARSTSIASIDDATASGVCSCKNSSGTQIDTFTCHVPVNNSAPTLNWGQTSTIGTVDGTPLTINMPANPNIDTKYSAGTGLTLSGTTFNVNIPNYKMSDGSNPDETYIMTLDKNQGACHPSGYTIGGLVNLIKNLGSAGTTGASSGVTGWFKIGNILVQWMKISTGREYYYPYGTYVSPPLGFYSHCSQDYQTTNGTTDFNGLLHVSTEKCYYGQDEDNRFPDDISLLVLGIASTEPGNSLGGVAASSSSETPTTHLKTYILSDTELNKVSSNANAFSDEEVFNFIKGIDPGAVSLVHYEREFILDEGGHQGLIRITSIKYYTTTA